MIIANKTTGILVVDPYSIYVNDKGTMIVAVQNYEDQRGAVIAVCPTNEIALTLFNTLLEVMRHNDYIVIDGDDIGYCGCCGYCGQEVTLLDAPKNPFFVAVTPDNGREPL